MTKFRHRNITLQFHGSSVDAKLGNETEISINLKDLSAALKDLSAYFGWKKCLAIGGVAVATFFAARLIKKKWDWINIERATAEDKMDVSFSEEREREYDRIIQNKEMEVYLKKSFDDLEESVKKILEGEPDSQGLVDEIIGKLKDCKLSTIQSENSNLTTQRLIDGKASITENDSSRFFAVGNDQTGVTAQTVIAKDADVTMNVTRGAEFMTAGLTGEDLKQALSTFQQIADENTNVEVGGNELKKTFKCKFKPTETVATVIMELYKQEKKFFEIYRDNEKLDPELTIAQAARTGSTVNWKARKQAN